MKCSVEQCTRESQTKLGYCLLHYKRFKRHGDPCLVKRNYNPPQFCTVVGCSEKHSGKGFCSKHLKKFHKYGDPLGKTQHKLPKICSIPGCGKSYHAHGYCSTHANKLRRYGDPLGMPKEKPMKLSGGYRIAGQGEGRHIKRTKTNNYWMILCPCHPNADSKGYVQEHRLVMEVHLGRFLNKAEHVHHKDGNGLNNSLENLELITQQEHSQRHRYWLLSPKKECKPLLYENVKCKKEDCNKPAKVNGYCHNHNRDIWRQKRKALNLAYT